MNTTQNNYAFIDSQNLILSIRNQGWDIDFKRFRQYLRDRFFVSKAFLFLGFIPRHQPLYDMLRSFGYTLVFKPTLILPNGSVKGNVDAELVLHTMIEYPQFDQAVIVTGDGDFCCLVEYLENHSTLHRLIIPNKFRYSSLLRRFSRHISFLNNTREKLDKKKEA